MATFQASLHAFSILLSFVLSYNIEWSDDFTYFEAASRNPYTINLRGQPDTQSLVICFEELQDDKFSGLCEGATLDTNTPDISFGPKSIFQFENASNPYEIQIYEGGETGWTNYFLLAYTNGENRAEGPGKVLMGQYLPNGTITYSQSQVTFNPLENDQSVLVELQNNSYFIVCSSAGPRNEYDTNCYIGKYDTSSMEVTFGYFPYNITEGHTTHGMAISRINSYTFLVCYGEYVYREGVCVVGTVVGNFENGINTPIKFGNKILLDGRRDVDEVKIIHLNQTVLAICYTVTINGIGSCKLASVVEIGNSGEYTILIGPTSFDYKTDGIDSPTVFRVPPNTLSPNQDNPELLGICFVDALKGACQFAEVDLNSMTLNFDESETNDFADRGVGTINAIYLGQGQDSNVGKLVVCYIKFAGSTPLFNRGLCKYGTVINS